MQDVQNSYHKGVVYRIGITAAFAGLLFGVDVGIISGALKFVSKEFSLDSLQEGLVVSSLLIGALLGTLMSSPLSHHLGRKNTLLVSSIIFAVTSILSAISPNYLFLVIIRIFLGTAVGIASFVTPIYLSEIAPTRIRGRLISMYQLMVTVGILLAFLIDTGFSFTGNWRAMFGSIFIPAIILFLGAITLPQSPRWLMLVGQKEKAVKVLSEIFTDPQSVNKEIKDLEDNLSQTKEGWKIFKNSYFRRILGLGIVLQMIQIMTGLNTMMYFAPKIFALAGFDTTFEQMMGTILLGSLNIVTTVLSLFVIDRWGRRPLSFFGLGFMTVGMAMLGYCFHVGPDTELLKYTAVSGMLVFIFGFAISLGPVVWVMCAEIFPLRGRDIGVMFTTATNWGFSALLGGLFLATLQWIGASYTFYMLAVICVLSMIFIYYFAPETKNVSLEQIEKNLVAGKKLRDIGA